MEQLGGLLLDRADDLRVGVAGRVDRDPRREIEEEVAVDVLDRQSPRRGPARSGRRAAGSATSRCSSKSTWARALGPGDLRDDVRHRAVAGDPRGPSDKGAPRVGRWHSTACEYAEWIFRMQPEYSRASRPPEAACATPPSRRRVALLAHELRHVVHRQAGLAGRAAALPATERLDARPRAGRRAGAAVHVQHAGLDLGRGTLRPRPGPRCRRRPSGRRSSRSRGQRLVERVHRRARR